MAVTTGIELKLSFNNKILDETKTLVDYKIHENCTLDLLIRFKGGGTSFIEKNFF